MTKTALSVPVLLALLLLSVAATPASAQRSPGMLESLSVSGDAGATTLTVTTDRRLELTGNWLTGEELELTFPACVLADGVGELTPIEGVIASATARTTLLAGVPTTTLRIALRRPASVATKARKKRLELTFTPVAELAAAEPSVGSLSPESEPGAASAAPAESSTVAAQPAARDELSGEYRIGPGDLLEVSIFGLDDFDRTVRVLRDGSISLPLLGDLRLSGMTLDEAERTVGGILIERQLVNSPQVTIFVKEYLSRGVSVQGAVERPGVYQMIQQRTLLEILGEAGGLSGRENDRAGQMIFVIRKMSNDRQDRIEIDADQLINQGRADLNLSLFPGDIVLVPFAQKYRIYVSGAVVRPGPVDYLSSEGITVLQAITAAGGPTERGNLGTVKILRRLPDGSETRIAVNVKKIRKGKQEDVPLERSDTVIVGEWFF